MGVELAGVSEKQMEIMIAGFKEASVAMTRAVIKATFASAEFKIEMEHLVAPLWPINWRQRLQSWRCYFSSAGHPWQDHDEARGCIICSRCRWHLFKRPLHL